MQAPSAPGARVPVRRRRRRLLVAAALVILAGLLTHTLGSGPIAGLAGDALYAVMVYLVIAVAFPRARSVAVGAGALAICTLIELFQLTGLPARWAQEFWPVRLVLGVGFDGTDLVAYAVGACATALVDIAIQGGAARD